MKAEHPHSAKLTKIKKDFIIDKNSYPITEGLQQLFSIPKKIMERWLSPQYTRHSSPLLFPKLTKSPSFNPVASR